MIVEIVLICDLVHEIDMCPVFTVSLVSSRVQKTPETGFCLLSLSALRRIVKIEQIEMHKVMADTGENRHENRNHAQHKSLGSFGRNPKPIGLMEA